MITGSFVVNSRIFDRWLDRTVFCGDLIEIGEILALRSGTVVSCDNDKLNLIHERWVSESKAWLERLLPPKTKRLSHLKYSALIAHFICSFDPFKISEKKEMFTERPSIQDSGYGLVDPPNQMSDKDRIIFLDGGSHYIAWQIAYHLCEFFEENREDRIDPYESRITEEFEMDMVSCLISGQVSAQSFHMILKALFLRD